MKLDRLIFVVLLCAGCGGSSTSDLGDQDAATSSDASSADGSISDASRTSDGGPFACGSTSCANDAYCIHPCCGGVRPLCVDLDDAGACPVGTSNEPSACEGSSATAVCAPGPCIPAPPFCASTATCGGESVEPGTDSRNVSCLCE
ncbi:MAG: hypothetical protein ABI183_20820 [Polyangiaceae bacterium]